MSGRYIAACFATNEVLYMCAALPSVTLNTEPEHLKLKAHFCQRATGLVFSTCGPEFSVTNVVILIVVF